MQNSISCIQSIGCPWPCLPLHHLQPSSSLPNKFSSPGNCFPCPKYTISIVFHKLHQTLPSSSRQSRNSPPLHKLLRPLSSLSLPSFNRSPSPLILSFFSWKLSSLQHQPSSSLLSRFTTLSFTFTALSAVPCPFRLTSPSSSLTSSCHFLFFLLTCSCPLWVQLKTISTFLLLLLLFLLLRWLQLPPFINALYFADASAPSSPNQLVINCSCCSVSGWVTTSCLIHLAASPRCLAAAASLHRHHLFCCCCLSRVVRPLATTTNSFFLDQSFILQVSKLGWLIPFVFGYGE